MITATDRLEEVAKRLQQGESVEPITVRDFLAWFDAQRRGSFTVWWMRRHLEAAGLETEPDFQSAYIDSPISFILANKDSTQEQVEQSAAAESKVALGATEMSEAFADPTYRISKLAAANNAPIFVAPDASLQQAVTIMLANDFSQLPVMTNERDVKGVISWISIGARLALGKGGTYVRELMDGYQQIPADTSLFQAIPIIVQSQYVLVRGSDNRITGIVTASDLSLQFQQMTEPFLLLGEIENHIRRILGDKFSREELSAVQDGEREIDGVADLTFGDYVRLLENDGRWQRLRISVDRVTFCTQLDEVRRIRNDVMHFDPDGIPPSDLERLRDFARFLQRLQGIGVS